MKKQKICKKKDEVELTVRPREFFLEFVLVSSLLSRLVVGLISGSNKAIFLYGTNIRKLIHYYYGALHIHMHTCYFTILHVVYKFNYYLNII